MELAVLLVLLDWELRLEGLWVLWLEGLWVLPEDWLCVEDDTVS